MADQPKTETSTTSWLAITPKHLPKIGHTDAMLKQYPLETIRKNLCHSGKIFTAREYDDKGYQGCACPGLFIVIQVVERQKCKRNSTLSTVVETTIKNAYGQVYTIPILTFSFYFKEYL